MELIPPSPEDVGFILWGAGWREHMAVSPPGSVSTPRGQPRLARRALALIRADQRPAPDDALRVIATGKR